LGIDLEKAPGRYELKVAAQEAAGKEIVCTANITVRAGRFATERLRVGKQFVEPNPEQVRRANEERDRLREIFDGVTPERLWNGKFRVPLDGVTAGSNFGKRRILNGNPGSPRGGADLPGTTGTPVHAAQRGRVVLADDCFSQAIPSFWIMDWDLYAFTGTYLRSAQKQEIFSSWRCTGKVGATGWVTGPHLHWGLTVERARANPATSSYWTLSQHTPHCTKSNKDPPH
jgi:murein DD-endopeptidase MepM/ murein hydrolase activator NlpD